MMPDIFSSFDPMAFSNIINPLLTLSMSVFLMTMTQLCFWAAPYRMSIISASILTIMYQQLTRTLSVHLKGLTTLISSLFMLLILVNLIGLNPYSMSLSSHLIFTLTFGLPLWLTMIVSSMLHNPKSFIAHLLPDGAPTWLNPFLILIETISITVRPITLSFRLAANMSAGHIVLSLVGLYAAVSISNTSSAMIALLAISISYILFEVAICAIQAYIFCLLLSLYSDDHSY